MKKLTFVLGLLLTFQSCAQPIDIVEWNTPYFQITYSQSLEQPVAVFYRVACTDGTASRKGLDFRTEEGIHTSDDADYYNNEWDKGHMAPAASFNCTEDMLWETFSYVNCALQHEKLNRGVWKKLEQRERFLMDSVQAYLPVEVFIAVDFETIDLLPTKASLPTAFYNFETINYLPTGAAIPTGFYKEIVVGDKRECYWFANQAPVSNQLSNYRCDCRN
mgnify:CR=1 FL=1